MRVMVMVKAGKDYEAGAMPSQKLLAEMGKFNQELIKAGVLLAADGLHPSSKGKRVRFSGLTRKRKSRFARSAKRRISPGEPCNPLTLLMPKRANGRSAGHTAWKKFLEAVDFAGPRSSCRRAGIHSRSEVFGRILPRLTNPG